MPGPDTLQQYPTPAARNADLAVHIVGLALGAVGGAILLGASPSGQTASLVALSVYALGLILMLSFSLAYNFHSSVLKERLRRLDHAGIFLMIAGTYTPFTTLVLRGFWAWTMTIAVWVFAALGIFGKAANLRLPEKVWTAIYIVLGWLIVVAAKPIADRLSLAAIVLLIAGGLVYTAGAAFYALARHAFWRSIWHGHVVVAACCHWAAIFISAT